MHKFPENAMIGLEVHMQLNTSKLFCRCPSNGNITNGSFIRILHPSSGESGGEDTSALFEESRRKRFKYIVSTNSCLVETDEEPPKVVDNEALMTALTIAQTFGSIILDSVIVMRKVVIDGSNTSGFQRTAIIALGGAVAKETIKSEITTMSLEEDSCRKIEENGNIVTYSLDRLGTPLIEISTEPDMKTPEQAIEIAKEIGERMMVLGKLKKGADSIRQDVNFSMGYGRVEIKGVSKLSAIKDILNIDAERQANLSESIDEIKKRGGFSNLSFVDHTDKFLETESNIIIKGIESGKKIFISKLENFRGFLKSDKYKMGREIADALKQVSIKGIIHYDELPAFGLTVKERDIIAKTLELNERGAFLLLIIDQSQVDFATTVIEERIKKLMNLDFSETRAAMEDNTTRYMRPLSGSSRMYPETDILTFKVEEEMLESSRKKIPKSIDETKKFLHDKYLLSSQDAETILMDQKLQIFQSVANEKNGKLTARILLHTIPEMEKKYNKTINEKELITILEFCGKKELGRYSMERAFDLFFEGKANIENILDMDLLKPLTEKEIILIMDENNIDEKLPMGIILERISSVSKKVVDPSILAAIMRNRKNIEKN
jgi:glutamyl-tRNA(Gln) amidotransferase subunit E